MTINITPTQYEALLRYAEVGAAGLGEPTEFAELKARIDTASSITRYFLMVRYQTMPVTAPKVGDPIPAGKTLTINLLRKITRADVDTLLYGIPVAPGTVYVTPDPNGLVGWYELAMYPF